MQETRKRNYVHKMATLRSMQSRVRFHFQIHVHIYFRVRFQ